MLILGILLACQSGPEASPPIDPDAITTTARPDGRSEILSIADPSTRGILVFGGSDGPIVNQIPKSAFRDDTWLFTAGTGWEEITSAGPSPRGRYGIALDATGHRALLWGGRFRQADQTGDYRLLKDLWAFDFATKTWSEIDTGSGGPKGRYYPTVAWDDETDTLYVFGGAANEDPLAIDPRMDLWSWTAAGGWTEIDITGDEPSSRVFYGATWDQANHRIWLFGGQVGDFQSMAFQDTWALDVRAGTWEEVNPGNGKSPSTRMQAMMVWDTDHPVVFGGHTDIGDSNDVWTLDPATRKWELLRQGDTFTGEPLGCLGNPSEVPANYVDSDLDSPERRHLGMGGIIDGSLYIFGGIHSECGAYLDDTWRYDFAANAWHELIPARSGEACSRRGDDCQCLCL
jgi:N-acetylneuraminic acid mutarotase